jgi:hypothetical protein
MSEIAKEKGLWNTSLPIAFLPYWPPLSRTNEHCDPTTGASLLERERLRNFQSFIAQLL